MNYSQKLEVPNLEPPGLPRSADSNLSYDDIPNTAQSHSVQAPHTATTVKTAAPADEAADDLSIASKRVGYSTALVTSFIGSAILSCVFVAVGVLVRVLWANQNPTEHRQYVADNVNAWFFWLAFNITFSWIAAAILDTVPWIITTARRLVWGVNSTQREQTWREFWTGSVPYVKIMIYASGALASWAVIFVGIYNLRASTNAATESRAQYTYRLFQVVQLFFFLVVIFALERMALHTISRTFHRKAYAERIATIEKQTAILDVLKAYQPNLAKVNEYKSPLTMSAAKRSTLSLVSHATSHSATSSSSDEDAHVIHNQEEDVQRQQRRRAKIKQEAKKQRTERTGMWTRVGRDMKRRSMVGRSRSSSKKRRSWFGADSDGSRSRSVSRERDGSHMRARSLSDDYRMESLQKDLTIPIVQGQGLGDGSSILRPPKIGDSALHSSVSLPKLSAQSSSPTLREKGMTEVDITHMPTIHTAFDSPVFRGFDPKTPEMQPGGFSKWRSKSQKPSIPAVKIEGPDEPLTFRQRAMRNIGLGRFMSRRVSRDEESQFVSPSTFAGLTTPGVTPTPRQSFFKSTRLGRILGTIVLYDSRQLVQKPQTAVFMAAADVNRYEAKKLARKIWKSLRYEAEKDKDGRTHLVPQDFIRIFPDETEAREAFKIFDTDNGGDVTRSELKNTILRIYSDRRDLVRSLHDISQAISSLDTALLTFGALFLLLISVSIFQIQISKLITSLYSIVIAASFIFSSAATNAFNSVIFCFVTHPWDCGDRVFVGVTATAENLVVERMGLWSTEFTRVDGTKLVYFNSQLAQQIIVNVRRSVDMGENATVTVGLQTPWWKILKLTEMMNEWLATDEKKRFDPAGTKPVLFSMDQLTNSMTLLFYMVHKENWQNWGARFARRTAFHAALAHYMKLLEITYVGVTQPVASVHHPKLQSKQNTSEYTLAEIAPQPPLSAGTQPPTATTTAEPDTEEREVLGFTAPRHGTIRRRLTRRAQAIGPA